MYSKAGFFSFFQYASKTSFSTASNFACPFGLYFTLAKKKPAKKKYCNTIQYILIFQAEDPHGSFVSYPHRQ